MAVTEEWLTPKVFADSKIGTAAKPWSEMNAASYQKGGVELAVEVSPAFTGTPTAPTATPSDNSTQLATTAYADAQAALRAAATHAAGHIQGAADEIDGDKIDIDLTLVNITADTAPAEVDNAAQLSAIIKGIDNALVLKASTTHKATHIQSGSDEIDGDKIDIDLTLSNITPDTTAAEVDDNAQLGAIIAGIDNALATFSSATHQSRHIRGGADELDGDKLDIDLTLVNITADTSPAQVDNAAHLTAILKGIDNALDFDIATIDVTFSNFTPDTTPAEVTLATQLGAILKGIDNALAAGAVTAHQSNHIRGGSDELDGDKVDIDITLPTITPDTAPAEVTSTEHLGAILKGFDDFVSTLNSGKASTAHTATHIRGGSDEIDGDKIDIDLTLVNITADTAPAQVDNAAHLTAIIKGIDNELGTLSTGKASATHQATHIKDGSDELDGDKLDIDLTLVNITADATPAEVSSVAHLGAIIKGIDNALALKATTTHKATHIQGGSDELDGDQLDIDISLTNITPDTTPSQVSDNAHLGAIIAGIDNAIGANLISSAENDAIEGATGTPSTSNPFLLAKFDDLTQVDPFQADSVALYDDSASALKRSTYKDLNPFRYDFTGLHGGSATDMDGESTDEMEVGRIMSVTDETDSSCIVQRHYKLTTDAFSAEQTVTVNAGSDLWTASTHGFRAGDPIEFLTSDTLPANVLATTIYYVIANNLTADDFEISATKGGSTFDVGDTGTGTHEVMRLLLPFQVRPTDHNDVSNIRTWILESEGLDVMSYEIFGPAETITIGDTLAAYAETDFEVCAIGANLAVAFGGSGSGTQSLNVEINGVDLLASEIDHTAIGQVISTDIDTAVHARGIIYQGDLIEVSLSDLGGTGPTGTGLRVFLIGKRA